MVGGSGRERGSPSSRGAGRPGHSAGFLPRPLVHVSQDLTEFLPSRPEGSNLAQTRGRCCGSGLGWQLGSEEAKQGFGDPVGPSCARSPCSPTAFHGPWKGFLQYCPTLSHPWSVTGYVGVWLLSFTPQCSGTPTPAFCLSN